MTIHGVCNYSTFYLARSCLVWFGGSTLPRWQQTEDMMERMKTAAIHFGAFCVVFVMVAMGLVL